MKNENASKALWATALVLLVIVSLPLFIASIISLLEPIAVWIFVLIVLFLALSFQGLKDWVPSHTKACKVKIDSYSDLVSTRQAKTFSDDRNRLLWFTAKSVYYGFKGKKSFTSKSNWSSKSGGRCYVSGYTTSSGIRVSGYYRRCP